MGTVESEPLDHQRNPDNLIYNSIKKNEIIGSDLLEMKDLYIENYRVLLKGIWHK